MDISDPASMLLALSIGSGLKYAALRWISQKNRKVQVGKVSKLFVYPLKSGRELPGQLKSVSLTRYGIYTNGVGDRY